jgi:hypothetical protein
MQTRTLTTSVVPFLSAALAVAAGAIHLAHNYLSMSGPSGGAGIPAAGAAAAAGPSGLMSLIMPHLSQVMLLNFAAFVGLAVLLVAIGRQRPFLRVSIDVLLAGLSVATLYAWNAMGRANLAGTGTMALIVEVALIVVALADAAFVAVSHSISHRRRGEVVLADR